MEYRSITEVIPRQCPNGGQGNCIGCRYAEGIAFYESDEIYAKCTIDEEEQL